MEAKVVRAASSIHRFFRPRKKVGHEFFLRHYLPLHCPTSQRDPPPLHPPPVSRAVQSISSLDWTPLNRNTRIIRPNKFTTRRWRGGEDGLSFKNEETGEQKFSRIREFRGKWWRSVEWKKMFANFLLSYIRTKMLLVRFLIGSSGRIDSHIALIIFMYTFFLEPISNNKIQIF